MELADIEQQIADCKLAPDLFNGATRVVLSQSAYDAIVPHMHVAFPCGGPSVEVSKALPPGYGTGWRPWQTGDDPILQHFGPVLVWFLGPK